MFGLNISLLETLGGAVAALGTLYLLYKQNKIMEEQNRIMREQLEREKAEDGATAPVALTRNGRFKRYWPMMTMLVLTLATWSALGLFINLRKPTIVEKIVEKPVPTTYPEQVTVVPVPSAEPPKQSKYAEAHPVMARKASDSSQPPSVQQSNSGGVNVQQATVGENSPIINSPITVGNVPKRISPTDLTAITQYLSEAKTKARIRVAVAQNSNAVPFANDVYKAFKDAGWTMEEPGVSEVIMFWAPGKKFQGVEVMCKGLSVAPNEQVLVHEGEPLFYVGTILKALKVPMALKRDPDQKDADLITLQFEGLPD
jgi:hypothetical protein